MTKEIMPKDVAISDFDVLFPPAQDESRILLGCSRQDYSASAIARAVEDCNAHVLNLNVTSIPSKNNDDLVVDLRVNHRNSEAISRSLTRYGFDVIDARSNSAADMDSMRHRAAELLRYLEL